jgi:hypothetical protein
MVDIIVGILWNLVKWIWGHARWIGLLTLILIIEVIILALVSNEKVDEGLHKPDLEIVGCQVERIEDNGYRLRAKIANNGSELCIYVPSLELYVGEEYTQRIYLSVDSGIYPEDTNVGERIPAGRTVEIEYVFLDEGEVNEGSMAMLTLSEYTTRAPKGFEFRFVVEESA